MAPYRTPVFNELATYRDVGLRVLYLAETDPQRAWPLYRSEMRYDYHVLPELFRFRWHGSWMHVSRGLIREIRAWRPKVVVAGGWDQPANLVAFALRRILTYAFACWVESTLRDVRPGSWLTEAVKRRVVRGSDALIVPGAASRDYVSVLGAASERVWTAPNAVDNSLFARGGYTDRARCTSRCRFLYVGRLHPVKGIHVLLRAWKNVTGDLGTLSIVGDGPQREEIVRWIEELGLGSVEMHGHLDRDALADQYAQADVFVFPSLSDPWGLVINEAMAAGLPMVTTSAPGAVDDLVEEGVTGLIVAPGDAEALAQAMTRLAIDKNERLAMGRAARARVEGFSPERCAAGLADAIRGCAARGAEGGE